MDVPPPDEAQVAENLVTRIRRHLQVLELRGDRGDDDDESLRSDSSAPDSLPELEEYSPEGEEDDIILDADDVVDWQQHVEQAVDDDDDDDDGDDSLHSDDTAHDSMPPLVRGVRAAAAAAADDDDDTLRSVDTAHNSIPPLLIRRQSTLTDSEDEDGLLTALDVIEGHFRRYEPEDDDNKKKDDSTDESECKQQPSFAPFSRLHEDIQTNILSFVATIPFEDPTTTTRPSVIHVLPYVSKHFLDLARSNGLWKLTMERLLIKDPDLWIKGLKKLHLETSSEGKEKDLLQSVHETLSEPGFYEMFRMVVEQHVVVEGPIFLSPSSHDLFKPTFVANFTKPSDRLLIQNVIEGLTEEDNGVVLNKQGKPPTLLLYTHGSHRAFLTEVRHCTFLDDGARVTLKPVARVRICSLSEDKQEQGLIHARCFRLMAPEIQELKQRNHRVVPGWISRSFAENNFGYWAPQTFLFVENEQGARQEEQQLPPFLVENEQGAEQEEHQQQIRN